MKVLNPQHNPEQISEGYSGQSGAPLNSIHQKILDKLKQQQQNRIAQKMQAQQEKLYLTEPVISQDLMPASGQFIKSQDIKHQSQRTLSESKNLIQQTQSHQKLMSGLANSKNSTFNNTNSQNQSMNGESPAKDHLLVMTIDLGEGNCDILHVYEYDDPVRKAEAFCQKHGLTKEAMEILAKNIEVNKQIVITERQHQLYHSTQYLRGQSPQYYSAQDNYASVQIQSPQQQSIRQNYYKSQSSNPNVEISNDDSTPVQQKLMQEAQPYPGLPQNGEDIQNNNIYHNQQLMNQQSPHDDQNEDYQVIHPSQKESIFDRLYGEASKKKQRIEQKKQLEQSQHLNSTYRSTKRVIGNNEVEIGVYLYLKGEELKRNKNKNKEDYQQKMEEQLKELSFKPELNPNSVRIALNKRSEQFDKTEDALIKQGQLYKEKKDIKKSERESQQLQECTFKPEVEPMSTYLYEMKKREQKDYPYEGKFDKLHKEYIKRNQRQEERQAFSECTFHPQITRPPKVQEPIPFVDRMMKSATEKEKKIQELKIKQQLEQQQEDVSTFQPQIGRPPAHRNVNNLPVHEYLYNKKEEKKIKQENLIKAEQEKQLKKQTSSSEKSNQIVESLKKNTLFQIFSQLDSDGDGLISQQNIDIQNLPDKVFRVIEPLFVEMEQCGFTLNFEQFYECSMKLISNLTIAQKDDFFYNYKEKWDEKKSKYDIHEYKPMINSKSQKLARKRSYEKFEGVYNHGMILQQQKQEKLHKIKEQLVQRELDECSFKPQLYKPMNIYSFTNPQIKQEENNLFGIQSGYEIGEGQYKIIGVQNNGYSENLQQ
ncbi:hypothetical protein ABPG74_011749 [Tetrahymena malaccensis]